MSVRSPAVRTGLRTITVRCAAVTPAQAGVQEAQRDWDSACAGMATLGADGFYGNGGDGRTGRLSAACFARGTLTPALSLEGEGVSERNQSLEFGVQPPEFGVQEERAYIPAIASMTTREPLRIHGDIGNGRIVGAGAVPLTSGTLTPALSLEGEGVPEGIRSFGVVVQHLAQLLFGHTGRAQQYQDDFGLESLGLGKGRAGGADSARADGRRVRHRDRRHSFALGEIGGDPRGKQVAELRQRVRRGLCARDTVVERQRHGMVPPLALPGYGRQAVRHVAHVYGDGVQRDGVGGRRFLRQKHLRRQREIGQHRVNALPLHDAAGQRGQVSPIATGLGRGDDDGKGCNGGGRSVFVHGRYCTNWPQGYDIRLWNPAAFWSVIPAYVGIHLHRAAAQERIETKSKAEAHALAPDES